MAKTRRQYSGGAVSTTVTSSLAASGVTTFVIASSTGWPSSAGVPFYVVVSPQTSSEEKMSVTISGTTLTIVSRGVDGTSASSHANGATVYPVITAIDMDEANELTAKYASRGSIVYQGATTFEELAKGSSGLVLKAGTNDPEWGQVNTAGIADDAITAAKILAGAVGSSEIANNAVGSDEIATDAVTTAKILDGAVTSAKILDGTIVNGDIATTAAIDLAKLATGALPTTITIASANIVNGTIVADDLASNSVTTAKITDANVTNTKLDYSTVPQMTVSTSDPTGGKNGDIWVKVV